MIELVSATRFLRSLVHERLVLAVESKGFARVKVSFTDPQWRVPGSDIELERPLDQVVDSVTFSFEKYGSPRFQIHAMRRERAAPHAFVRSASLVVRSSQYYHFWGKPWWLPTKFWSERASKRVVASLESPVQQLIHFLETGEAGPNISKGR